MTEQHQFIVALANALAWPLFWLVVLAVLHRPVFHLARSISKISHGKTAVEFDKGIREVAASASAEPHIDASALPEGARPSTNVSRVVLAWASLERTLRERVSYGAPSTAPTDKLFKEARSRGLVSAEVMKSILGLYDLRNLAVHSRESEITDERATEFVALADAIRIVVANAVVVSDHTAAAIIGQGELATQSYESVKKRLLEDFPILRGASAEGK